MADTPAKKLDDHTEDKAGSVGWHGFGADEADDKHPGSRREAGVGREYGQGVGYGGYSHEQSQGRSQTGAEELTDREGEPDDAETDEGKRGR